MAKVDRILCPFCIFTAKYVDLIFADDDEYVCPSCAARFSYEELMYLYSFTQYNIEPQDRRFEPKN